MQVASTATVADAEGETARLVERFAVDHAGKDAASLVRASIDQFGERLAVVSSFGAESAVLLHLVAAADPTIPVVFIDTRRHFEETLAYRDRLIAHLGLTEVRVVGPNPLRVLNEDPEQDLFGRDPDRCCRMRKSEPLLRALRPFDAWISGRKRHQTESRANVPFAEADGRHLKVNPLAAWGKEDLDAYMQTHRLPAHPLVALGFPSIGCYSCTSRVGVGEDPRSGRWRGRGKTECGIHLGLGELLIDGGGI